MMKQGLLIVLGATAAFMAACTPEAAQKVDPVAPEFKFSIAESSFSVDVDSTVFFGAELLKGTDVKTVWSVNGEKIAGTPSVKWTFSELGVSVVNFQASNSLGKVEKEYIVTVLGIPLVVSYSVEDSQVEAVVGTPLEIAVTVVSGDKSTVHSWMLDDEPVGDTPSFSKTFMEEEIGTHILSYYGENIDGESASKEWAITVVDLPLEVNFTPAEDAVESMETRSVNFAASIVHGATGATYSWKVDGEEVSTESTYVFDCTAQGVFTVSATVTNLIGEKAEKTWTLTVTEKETLSLLFCDFESYEVGPGIGSYFIGNVASGVSVTQVVENPYKTATNSSNKVLVDRGSIMNQNNTTSGYFKFKINTFPDGVTNVPDRANYTKIRVKIYLGECGYTPLLQEDNKSTKSTPSEINGIPFDTMNPTMDAWNAAIKTNDWNVFTYDFTTGKYSNQVNDLSQTSQVQFRVFVNFNNQNQKPVDVYFDDIEFLE